MLINGENGARYGLSNDVILANFVTIKNKDDDKLHCIVKLY